ncbi:hypothetical protein SAMN06297251_102152 [Fulvimarina manganoxydans]|uniref:Phage tail protein n=1 Tax=Fulvimarina manganoxydans TaxID=937218 RepID=A0A1W1Z487_9HYPH|nr:phage tail protein [Fulvimarina manganoxydans]SMC43287.1 hypothetical protein SAMN06297251_102152 [Fulvimarina manganoxydans]
MAGPVIMALGPFAFEAHGFGFDKRRRSQGTRWAEVQVAGGMNPSQWTGGDGYIEQISGVLFPVEFGGERNLFGLYEAAKGGQILPLVALNGTTQNIFDMFVIEAINDDPEFVDEFGRPRKNAYAIDLKAYQGSGSIAFNPASVLSYF